MKKMSQKTYIIISVLSCAIAMSFVDGVIQPGYAAKSAVKVCLFLLVPVTYFLRNREELNRMKDLFIPKRKELLISAVLGSAVYGFLVGGYLLLARFVDLTEMILVLTAQSGVSAANFLWVSLYISFINSFLEEFLFRGFAFLTLKEKAGRKFAYLFSAAVFAFYHFGMIAGSVNIPVWIAAMAGLFVAGCVLNWLNEKSGNIYVSWLVHMFANFGINTVGFMIFGLI